MKNSNRIVWGLLALAVGCSTPPKKETPPKVEETYASGTFGHDLDFLRQHEQLIILGDLNHSAVVLVRDYQGRAMTSTSNGLSGTSYGWLNHDLISKDSLLAHMNPFGGEDRIWLGPEGGQYSIFFKKGTTFDFANWQTPSFIDTEPFDLVSRDSMQATFSKQAVAYNYSGFEFPLEILRQVKLWTDADIERELGISLQGVRAVGFESNNSVKNVGNIPWTKKTGLISIWILGMFNPSDETTIVIPYGPSPAFTSRVTDNYFGSIPADRLIKTDGRLLLKADGKFRGKVGVAPDIAKNIAGSYDSKKHILTIVRFDLDRNAAYVNSKWEIQKEPFRGDAVNSYNDGPLASGGQLGPFYELESSSPARELKAGESVVHRHATIHIEGDEAKLDEISRKTLGISLNELAQAFAAK